MSTLTYPLQHSSGDCVTFSHFEYVTNRNGSQRRGGRNGIGWPAALGTIKLYMPTSTPAMSADQGWGEISNPGPIGELQQDAAKVIGGQNPIEAIKEAASGAGNAGRNIPGFFHQGAVNAAAEKIQMEPNHVTQLGQGKIFNPNIELMYDGPRTRAFNMSFDFIPTSAKEASIVNEIILEFKKWSSPSSNRGGSMYEVPHLWKVQYYTKDNPDLMNQFKPAAITKLVVQANPTTDMHSTFVDGFPTSTSMSIEFREADVILREDHEAVGGQGY